MPITGKIFLAKRGEPDCLFYLLDFVSLTNPTYRYYSAYLEFFTEEVLSRGALETIETYVFSPNANDEGGHMLIRIVSKLYVPLHLPRSSHPFSWFASRMHPLIQLGVGSS
jgi:hypothetical protein